MTTMNALLVAAVLIPLLALVHADPDKKLVDVLTAAGFDVVVMTDAEQQELKDAVDAGKGVTNKILAKFTHVFYYTTDAEGNLTVSITHHSGNGMLNLSGAISSVGHLDADKPDDVFIASADKLAETFKTALDCLKGKQYRACVESGLADADKFHHVLAFTATE